MVKTDAKVGMPVVITGNTHEGTRVLGPRVTVARLIKIPCAARVFALLKGSEEIWMLDVLSIQVPFHHTEFEPA